MDIRLYKRANLSQYIFLIALSIDLTYDNGTKKFLEALLS